MRNLLQSKTRRSQADLNEFPVFLWLLATLFFLLYYDQVAATKGIISLEQSQRA